MEREKCHLSKGTEEYQKTFTQFLWCLWRYSSHVPSHYIFTALAVHHIGHCSIYPYAHTYMLVCTNTDQNQITSRNNFRASSLGIGSNTAMCE